MAESPKQTIARLERTKKKLQRELDQQEKKDNEDKKEEREKKRRQGRGGMLIHVLPVVILSFAIVLYCGFQDVMWGGAIEPESSSYSDPSRSQSNFVSRYLGYTDDVNKSVETGAGVNIDPSQMYADGFTTCSNYVSNARIKEDDLVYAVGSPTYDMNALGGSPYIVNMRMMYTQAIDDMIRVEKDVLGSSATYKTAQEYADIVLAGGGWYTTYGPGDVDYLSIKCRGGTKQSIDRWTYRGDGFGLHGSLGNAILIRDWWSAKKWNTPGAHSDGFWSSIGGSGAKITAKGGMGYTEVIDHGDKKEYIDHPYSLSTQVELFNHNSKLNLILVKASLVDAYYEGTIPPEEVYFVEFTEFDSKSHSYPWGLFQSWSIYDKTVGALICKPAAGGSYAGDYTADAYVQIDPDSTSYDYWKKVFGATVSAGGGMYGVPYIETMYERIKSSNPAVEGGMNVAYMDNFITSGQKLVSKMNEWGSGEPMSLVGILVPGLDQTRGTEP